MSKITVKTVDKLMEESRHIRSFEIPGGDSFKDLSTVIVIPTRGTRDEKATLNCKKCKHKNEYITTHVSGFHPMFIEYYKRLIKPMNVPVLEMILKGYEVGEAYNNAVEAILSNPGTKDFKYMLTIEDDNLVPFIPNSGGPLMMLYESIEKGYDVVGGLYFTKGEYSLPLIYGDPKENAKSKSGMFKVRYDYKDKPDQLLECNGMGMGFTLFKMDIFKDKRFKKPFFKTASENTDNGQRAYTQDLWFFEQARKLGYKVAVDTRVKVGHLDTKTERIY